MSNLVILKCDSKAKFEKKDCQRKFWRFTINNNWKSVPLCPIKWHPLKFFTKLHKILLLTGPPAPRHFLEQNIFFRRKIGKHKIFTCEEHMRLECIYWTRHKWQKIDSFFWICYFSSKLSYHSYKQRVCKIMRLIRTFVKTNKNLMCGSF